MSKQVLDYTLSLLIIIIVFPILLIIGFLILLTVKSSPFFTQIRIGQYGKPFTIYKFKTMQEGQVTRLGKFLRKTKVDELPQLFNILKGDMSFVGPRPDVPGYYDKLKGNNRRVLQLKPGITSMAAIKYRNEEQLLNQQGNPMQYNDQVIFPDKVKMNLEYIDNKSFVYDLKIIFNTIISIFK